MRITERGQITIPKALRERFGMHHNVEVEITSTPGGILIRKKGDNRPVMYTVMKGDALSGGTGEHSVGGHNSAHHQKAKDGEAKDGPEGETTAQRIHRILAERAHMRPVDRVSGILDHLDFDVDEYIEEIRGR